MPDIDIKVAKVHGDPFVWDKADLHAHAAQSGLHCIVRYGPIDPCTWPLVQSAKLENGKDHTKSKVPPPSVAYDAALMTDLMFLKPIKRFQYCERLY
jgi:hypothetical protein